MNTLQIIELVVLIVVTIGISVYYLIMAIKNKWINILLDTIKISIAEAEEKFITEPNKSTLKKNYVLEKVRDKCIELGIPYDTLYKLISKLIDKIIEHYNVIAKSDNKINKE